jgi:isoquinoline 1-oxidoreductase beta subunit
VTHPHTISRRDFIRSAALAGPGLLLALHLPSGEPEAAPAGTTGSFSPNAWLSIDPTGTVTITVAKSEMGQGVRTSLPMIVAEELEADWSKINIVQAPVDPGRYGSQTTGGSSSVRRSWETLRKAGATAREMLVAAAANEWGVGPDSCVAEKGSVIHRPSGRKKSYGELAVHAGTMPVPDNPPLKEPKTFRIIGTRARRLDIGEKVNGAAKFGIDTHLPGMVFAALARPPLPGGTLVRLDATNAKSVRGVLDVLRVGNSAAVIAESSWSAFRGRDALALTWDKGEYRNQNSEAIWKLFEERAGEEGNIERTAGDAKNALARAAVKIEANYRVPFAAHASMEPMNCTADVSGDGCEIWAPSQTPQDARSQAAEALGLPLEKVTVHVTLLGGGFGRRLENDYVVEAVNVSQAIKKPVKVVWTREDDMRHDFYRPASHNHLRAGIDRKGAPVAWLHRIVGPPAGGLVTGGSTPPYAIPNLLIDSHFVETGVPTGAWRSVGYSLNCFVTECFLDEIAHAAHRDPYEYRIGLLPESSRLRGALRLAATKSNWGAPLRAGTGKGIACVQGFGTSVAQVAEVSVSTDCTVKVHRVVCAVDCGPVVNPDTVEAQMESSIAFGLTAALKDEITTKEGEISQSNFDDYEMLRMDEMPKIEVHIVPSVDTQGGIGEPGVPPIAPAVANAIFAATGKRVRRLPIRLTA